MSNASHARSGGGAVSKAHVARGTINKMVTKPEGQPAVPSNIPGAASQGVPSAEADKMGDLARGGNNIQARTVIAAERGQTAYGPPVASSVARTGGQIGVAPGQFGAWARPLR
jgi:hypothetical protein